MWRLVGSARAAVLDCVHVRFKLLSYRVSQLYMFDIIIHVGVHVYKISVHLVCGHVQFHLKACEIKVRLVEINQVTSMFNIVPKLLLFDHR